MGSIGETLRTEREKQGFTLADIQMQTKIRSRYLEALENEDFSVIPGDVYVKGFIKNYAQALGLDGQKLADEYSRLIQPKEQDDEALAPVSRKVTASQAPMRPVLPKPVAFVCIGALVLALAVYGVIQFLPSLEAMLATPEPAPTPPVSGNPAPAVSPMPAPMEPKPEPIVSLVKVEGDTTFYTGSGKPLTLRLTTLDGRCWVRVKLDDDRVEEFTMNANEQRIFTADKAVWVRLGNPLAVKMTINEVPVETKEKDPHNYEIRNP